MLERLKEEILLQEEREFQAFALENILSEDTSDDEIEAMMIDDLEDEELMNENSNLDVYQDGDLSEDVSVNDLADNSEEIFLESVEEEMREGGFYVTENMDMFLEDDDMDIDTDDALSEGDEDTSKSKEDKADSGIVPSEDTNLEESEEFQVPTFTENEGIVLEAELLEDGDFE